MASRLAAGRSPQQALLLQLDDDPLRAADVAEPIAVFVTLHLANELRAAGSQASLGACPLGGPARFDSLNHSSVL
jgi:hypothetical protein